jgi:molybdate transport system regulatory protein
MKISARNVWKGTVKKVVKGAVNSEVTVALPGGHEVVAVITNASVKALGLKKGHECSAVVKASNVMIATDD